VKGDATNLAHMIGADASEGRRATTGKKLSQNSSPWRRNTSTVVHGPDIGRPTLTCGVQN
jgi:hypothetical protein